MDRINILSIDVDVIDLDRAADLCVAWGKRRESRYVCLANVHMTIEARHRPQFASIVSNGDLVVPDGAPLAAVTRLFMQRKQRQVRGVDLMRALCRRAAAEGVPVGFLGGRPETLESLIRRLSREIPELHVALAHSPPFRPLSASEQQAIVDDINSSGCGILFVGLGCPRQETWMRDQRGHCMAVMLGVGAAFDFMAGTVKEAPQFMRSLGLEWLHRFLQEPGRLWRRYATTNSEFLMLILLGLLGVQAFRPRTIARKEPLAALLPGIDRVGEA